ncbi:uncharacterized protein LOC128213782 isoform X2 [Mya arenaria]|uniref:uncharacterized protein LOC128213782 isoform X2 n=1 Tax=Mya arenaria TaxID=6604 RepID=UPI0022E5A649|nr:uncharacterized protein LOC128213782 isoform X2 [Mya arenaria]
MELKGGNNTLFLNDTFLLNDTLLMDDTLSLNNTLSLNDTLLSNVTSGNVKGAAEGNSSSNDGHYYMGFGFFTLTSKNIYFLIFIIIFIILFAIASVMRHHSQKAKKQKKEEDYLRYFYSVMPHSRIYGNLSDLFENEDKNGSCKLKRKNTVSGRKGKQKRNSRRDTRRQSLTDKIMNAMGKKYPYNPYVSEANTSEVIEENEFQIIIESDDDKVETRSNPELKLNLKKKKVQWRKYSFQNISTNI